MSRHQVHASAHIGAPASHVYAIIADYHKGHPRIVPPKYFRNLRVERGGIGAGTAIRFEMHVLGKTHEVAGDVTEPYPGRVLVETYPETKTVTTFVVEPVADARAAKVTIATELPVRSGLLGMIERFVLDRVLRRIYVEELGLLADYARATAPTITPAAA